MLTATEPVMFAAEFEPAELGRRRSPRAPVSFDAKIGRGGLDRALCKVTDLSIHGARIQTYTALKRGTLIWLTLPKAGPVIARVRWAGDFEAGCEFTEPLPDEMFARIVTV